MSYRLATGEKITKEMFIERIMEKMPSAYTPGSVVYQRVAKAFYKFSLDELDSLLVILETRLPTGLRRA